MHETNYIKNTSYLHDPVPVQCLAGKLAGLRAGAPGPAVRPGVCDLGYATWGMICICMYRPPAICDATWGMQPGLGYATWG